MGNLSKRGEEIVVVFSLYYFKFMRDPEFLLPLKSLFGKFVFVLN